MRGSGALKVFRVGLDSDGHRHGARWRGGARDRESVASVSVTLFSILDLRPLALERASESSLRSCCVTASTLSSLSQSNRGALETT